SGGFDSGAGSIYRLAGAPRERAWFALGARGIGQCKRDREKARGKERAAEAARRGEGAFPDGARDCAKCLCRAASARRLAKVTADRGLQASGKVPATCFHIRL